MKKMMIPGIVLSLLISILTGCAPPPVPDSTTAPTTVPTTAVPTESTAPSLEKLTQRVFQSGPFSEGLAVVVTESADGRACVINKNGEILFDLPVALDSGSEVVDARFVNGVLAIHGGLCDTAGKMTFPEDVGAQKFFTSALAGGYVPALVNAEGGAQIGILNTQMEWVVAPSAALYAKLCDAQGNLLLKNDEEVQYETARNFYFQGYLLIEGLSEWLELSTGELVPMAETGLQYPSYTWFSTTDHRYLDRNIRVRLNLSHHTNRETWTHFPFRNGLSILLINDPTYSFTAPYSFSLIDEEGNLFFDTIPLPSPIMQEPIFHWDTQYIVVQFPKDVDGLVAQVYSKDGALISQLYQKDLARISTLFSCKTYDMAFSDGVITITGYSTSRPIYVWHLTPTLEPLF